MKKEINELGADSFKRYGAYTDMVHPAGDRFGEPPIEFYRDILQQSLGAEASGSVSYSLCRLLKREFVIKASEYHNYCSEMILPLDGDILMHVGPASADERFPAEDVEIYRIPRGTAVCIRPGVWHQAAFAFDCDCVNILVALPERAYKNDCNLIQLNPEEYVEILVEK